MGHAAQLVLSLPRFSTRGDDEGRMFPVLHHSLHLNRLGVQSPRGGRLPD
jgi:hypothetical protein